MKSISEGVHFLVKLQAKSFTKNELCHRFFSRILPRFLTISYGVLKFPEHLSTASSEQDRFVDK